MSTGVPVRVVIVDDAPIVRDGLTMYLDSAEDIEVVARLSNGVELLDYLDTHRVDLVLMDVRMPVMDGPTALSRLTVAHPQVRVLFMTSFDDEEIVYQLLSHGGHGFLLKNATPEEIRAAVRAVVGGGRAGLADRQRPHCPRGRLPVPSALAARGLRPLGAGERCPQAPVPGGLESGDRQAAEPVGVDRQGLRVHHYDADGVHLAAPRRRHGL